ncbi:hypothetical protein L0B70_12095 [Kaistella sp. 97-N-M2]|uniref:hypothetical protein n=1 Tax=Kaistella sp. 97-N-M2 TaxID=2908645 RepID=UPI001F27A254|nr:hypothetical protein [Kaistella sp. 97-N-M2]UJF29564.1 hypothetical protein L0B70_12095 [Kaistella sp. 97-N-M2]
MIEVYSTNITKKKHAKSVLETLRTEFPEYMISLDLSDCDKILRVENPQGTVDKETVKNLVNNLGFDIAELEDVPLFADLQDSFNT